MVVASRASRTGGMLSTVRLSVHRVHHVHIPFRPRRCQFASAAESLENIHIEFPACIRALLRTAPAALSAFSCKAGNASESLRASLSVGFASSSLPSPPPSL